jgi:hypothetical protein
MRTFVKNGVSNLVTLGLFMVAVLYVGTIDHWYPGQGQKEK